MPVILKSLSLGQTHLLNFRFVFLYFRHFHLHVPKVIETQLCSEFLFSFINFVLFLCSSYVNNNITHQILITTKSNIPDCFFLFYSPLFSVSSLFIESILICSLFLLSSFLSSSYTICSLNYYNKFHLSLFLICSYESSSFCHNLWHIVGYQYKLLIEWLIYPSYQRYILKYRWIYYSPAFFRLSVIHEVNTKFLAWYSKTVMLFLQFIFLISPPFILKNLYPAICNTSSSLSLLFCSISL